MQEGFAPHSLDSRANWDSGDMVPAGNDASYDAEFYMGKVPNFEGNDYHEVPHLRLRLPGDNNRIYDQPVIMDSAPDRPSDPERFPRQWAAFKRGEQAGTRGTLLIDWEGAEPGDVRRLEMQGIRTVEQLAHIGDHQLHALGMGARALREQARAHVSGAQAGAHNEMADRVTKMSAILENLMAILTPEQIAAIQASQHQQPQSDMLMPEQQAAAQKRQGGRAAA